MEARHAGNQVPGVAQIGRDAVAEHLDLAGCRIAPCRPPTTDDDGAASALFHGQSLACVLDEGGEECPSPDGNVHVLKPRLAWGVRAYHNRNGRRPAPGGYDDAATVDDAPRRPGHEYALVPLKSQNPGLQMDAGTGLHGTPGQGRRCHERVDFALDRAELDALDRLRQIGREGSRLGAREEVYVQPGRALKVGLAAQ